MTKVIRICVVLTFFIGLVGCGRSDRKVLRVFNWGAYADMSIIRDFEDQFDCQVIYSTFDSMESLYTKISTGEQFDVIVPSDNMAQRLIKEGYVQEIDWSKVPNIKNIDPALRGLDFDTEDKYTALYLYGSIGLVYDKTVIDQNDLKAGWDILLNPKYRKQIFMYDTIRESFMVALKALGYSLNTTNEEEIKQAYEWLVNQRKVTDSVYVGDEGIDLMRNGEKSLAVMFSGDAASIMLDNEDLGFLMPEQGTNIFYDTLMITKDCEDLDLAHAFINFMLDDDNAKKTTLEVGYTSPNTRVFNEVKDDELLGFGGIKAYQPRIGNSLDEVYHYQDSAIKKIYDHYWTLLKAN